MRATAEAAPGKGRVGLILVETPANPTNGLIDLAGIATIAMSWASSMLSSPVVDNTIGPGVSEAAAAWRRRHFVFAYQAYRLATSSAAASVVLPSSFAMSWFGEAF